MALTWFRGKILDADMPLLESSADPMTPMAKDVITNSRGDKFLWYNLHDSADEYIGWVNINLATGEIEFGEPAA